LPFPARARSCDSRPSWLRSEDAELVALGIGEDVPLDLPVAGADHRRSQPEQLRLVADDVHMHPVLHRLRLGNRVDPDQRPLARRIPDRDRPVQRTRAFVHLAHVTESRAPPVGQSLMVAGVEAEILETCWHPQRVALAPGATSEYVSPHTSAPHAPGIPQHSCSPAPARPAAGTGAWSADDVE